jgi:hypothetical protein
MKIKVTWTDFEDSKGNYVEFNFHDSVDAEGFYEKLEQIMLAVGYHAQTVKEYFHGEEEENLN